MTLTSGGNLGVGTTTPGQRLTVVDAGNSNQFSGTFSVFANNLTQGVGIGYAGITALGSNANQSLFLDSRGGGDIVMQSNNTAGDVGIGTAAPARKFDVRTAASGNGTLVKSSTGWVSQDIDAQNGDAALRFFNNGAANWNMRNSPVNNNLQIYRQNSFEIFTIDYNNGNTGINQPTPTAQLDVNGSFKLTNGTQAAGRVLTSDAAGNATWQAPVVTPKVSFRAQINGITVPTSTLTNLLCSTIAFEEGGSNYNTGTGEYTVPVTGLYSIAAKYVWNTFAANTGSQNTVIRVNGSNVELGANLTSNTSQFVKGEARALLQLNAGDIVTIQAFQTTGSNATVGSFGTSDNNFSIYLIH